MLQTVDRPHPDRQRLDDDGAHLTLSEIASFVWYYKWSVLLCCILPLIAAYGYISTTRPLFTAQAQLLLESKAPLPTSDQTAASLERPLESPEIESQIALIRSERIGLAVLNQLKLWEEPELSGSELREGTAPEPPEATMRRSRRVLTTFVKNLDVRRNGLSYAIDIRYSSGDAGRAAQVANAVAQAFVADQLETRAEAVRAGGRWLEERIEQLRRQMNTAALRVQRFKVRRDYRIVDQGAKEAPAAEAQTNGDEGERETLEELESRAATYRRIYESYLQAYAESLQRQSFPVANARIITPATRPLDPTWPRPTLILALALLVGLILGFGQALIRHQFVRRRS